VTKCVAIEFSRKKHPVTCILLHPGTVNTDLSRPFHGNGECASRVTVEHHVYT
jgi:NAD(P)-dependent dehydrogenase (short-subunit alcohol dehydrogenase family)